jgi:hypothetical protein
MWAKGDKVEYLDSDERHSRDKTSYYLRQAGIDAGVAGGTKVQWQDLYRAAQHPRRLRSNRVPLDTYAVL